MCRWYVLGAKLPCWPHALTAICHYTMIQKNAQRHPQPLSLLTGGSSTRSNEAGDAGTLCRTCLTGLCPLSTLFPSHSQAATAAGLAMLEGTSRPGVSGHERIYCLSCCPASFWSCQHCLLPEPVVAAGSLGFVAHSTKATFLPFMF